MNTTHQDVERELRKLARPDKAAFLPKFFQAYPGGYGEGDYFLGVVVPDQRKVARAYRSLGLSEIHELLESEFHECRMTGLFILVHQFEKGDATTKKDIVDFYLRHTHRINNWDLVDATAPKILGPFVVSHPTQRRVIKKLAKSPSLWEQRIAVLATFALIRERDYSLTLELAGELLRHPHDLMHKGVGWMLREIGNRDVERLRDFLSQHARRMPRTMLRYAIEKLPQDERLRWMQRD